MIEAHGLCMNYGHTQAVKDVSFLVNNGEVVGLLGPNGAGKTTIMKILATQIVPTRGSAKVAGKDVLEDPLGVRASLGYLPEQAPLYEEMEVREYLDFVGKGRGLEGQELKRRIEWVAENCGLEKMWCRPLGQLSKGYKQRVGLAQALIHDPPVLILDEPTSGLDPLQIMEIRALVKRLAQGKAILFSTHILQEITAVSDRILIISNGTLRADGRLSDLSNQVITWETIRLVVQSEDDIAQEIEKIPGVTEVELREAPDGHFSYVIRGNRRSGIQDALARMLKDRDLLVKELYCEQPDLEKVFTALTREEKAL